MSQAHDFAKVWSHSPRGHGPDLRRFAVAVWRLVRDERDLHVDGSRRWLERDLQLQALEQGPELRLGQVL